MDHIAALSDVADHADVDVWAEGELRPLMDELLRYFLRRLPNRDLSADCLSDTMLVLWQKRGKLPRHRDQVRAYVYGVARKVLLSTQRKLAKASASQGVEESMASVASHSEQADVRLDVQRLLTVLKPADRELLLLTIWEQLSIAEAASVLGVTPAAARKRHSRAIKRLSERSLHYHRESIA